jgi:hypothetical protein
MVHVLYWFYGAEYIVFLELHLNGPHWWLNTNKAANRSDSIIYTPHHNGLLLVFCFSQP